MVDSKRLGAEKKKEEEDRNHKAKI